MKKEIKIICTLGPASLNKEFLKFADISMGEFLKICSKFTNKEIFKVDENQNVIQDKDGEVTKLKYDNT